MRSTCSNYSAHHQYLLSSGAATVASRAASVSPPRQTQPLQLHSQASRLSMASSNGSSDGGRIQQQIAAVATTTVASNYLHPHPHPQPPPMASNKLNSGQQAPQLAPVAAHVHYHNPSAGLGAGFKAALRHPQKFIHNLYSGGNTAAAKSGQQQQVAHGKQVLRASDQQACQQHQQPIQHQRQQLQHRPQVSKFPGEAPNDANHLEPRQEQYASQLRSSPLVQRFQHQPSQHQQLFQTGQQMQQSGPPLGPLHQQPAQVVGASLASGLAASSSTVQAPPLKSPPKAERSQQVNFNRNSTDQQEEAGESRKKKYLTAKYGQQQMSLIKKRLKIEMWLYEQLQELAKSTKSEAELDEIEIDLDQLLDMDDDETRRRWLKKTLEPFEDLQPDRIDKFIDDVLDQSKLL